MPKGIGIELLRISGGIGCDIVNAFDGPFRARIGRIVAIIPRVDNTIIEYIKEEVDGTESAAITSRSYISSDSSLNEVHLLAQELIVPDNPVTEIEVSDGSVVVYYAEYPWKHLGSRSH